MGAAACKQGADPREDPSARSFLLAARPSPSHPSSAAVIEKRGSGRAKYLGFDVEPKAPRAGDVVELRHYFESVAPFRGDYMVFVHGESADGKQQWFEADHVPVNGRVPTSRWRPGEIWVDAHRVRIPAEASAQLIEVFAGLFAGEEKLTVEAPPGGSDGRDRIHAGQIRLEGAPEAAAKQPAAPPPPPSPDLPETSIVRATGKITADGVLDEPDWAKAAVLGFADTMGRNIPLRWPTKLRLLYDAENLYVGFESVDEDISCPYAKRDDPIYDHETVELFLMPNVAAPKLGPYVELQASPKGIIFDAAFTARRQGMDTGFNASQTVGTKLDGTLNEHGDRDRGWVSEWVVPWKSLRGVERAPSPEDEWRMNAFRIENRGEYTAWSPPRVGDFHNVDRFGRLRFAQ